MRVLRIEIAIAALLLAPFAGYAIGYAFADTPARAEGALPVNPAIAATDVALVQVRPVREAGA